MRKISLFAALVVAMGAVSCVQDINDSAPVNNEGVKTFEASFGAMSKAVLEPGAEESKVAWEAGDQVSVLAGEGNYLYTAASAGYSTTLNTEATDVPSEGTFYAVYPYDADASLAGGVLTTALPAEQTAVLGSFSTHLAVAQTTDSKLAFKNVCGLVKATIDAENVTKVVFEGNNSEVVAGRINVTVSDTPSWTAVAEQGATSITLAPSSGTLAKGAYYFAVLPQTFAKGFKVTAYKGAEAWVIRNVASEYTLERADIMGGKSFFEIEGNGTEANPYILKTPEHLVGMRSLATYGGETWFRMANDINMEGVTDYIPVNNVDESEDAALTFERKIHFDGGNFTISNFTCDDTDRPYPSLFGVLYGSLKDLNVTNATITSTGQVAGIIGGYIGTTDKPATVTNVKVQGTVTSNVRRSGGFAGDVVGSTFTDCEANVKVNGVQDTGGFAGRVQGKSSFTRCSATVDVTTTFAGNARSGGFIGFNAGTETTITDCHILSGSKFAHNASTAGEATCGGFIGYGDGAAGNILKVSGCSVDIDMTVHSYGQRNSCFIGQLGYASEVTIENTSVKGKVEGSQNYHGGLIGRVGPSDVTIRGCSFSGSVKGASGVGGLVGAVEAAGSLKIYKSSATGTVTGTGHNCGGLVGLVSSSNTTTIENCWCNSTVTMASSQFGGGIVGGVQNALVVKNCYALGEINVSRGAGGIVGQIKGAAPVVEGCIAWNSIKTSRSNTQYSPGAIVGNIQIDGVYKKCYRKADMSFTDVAMKLVDHDDVESGRPPLPTYDGTTADHNQYAYHGKKADENATVSSVAQSIGWSSEIWDFSGDFPTLK